jgi:hypothetical protein
MNIYTNNEVGYRKNRSVERERCEPSEGFAGISSISNKEKKNTSQERVSCDTNNS